MKYFDISSLFGDSIPGPIARGISRWMAVDWLNEFLGSVDKKSAPGESIYQRALMELEIDYRILAGGISLIPKAGPTIVVANHPFGCIDAMILSDIITRARPDSKILANHLLNTFPPFQHFIIEIDPFGGREAARRNVVSIRSAMNHLKGGGLVALFPAGEVASFRLSKRKVMEKEWSGLVEKLMAATDASVVPVHFQGRNSSAFYISGMIHPMLRTVRLIREMRASKGRCFPVRIGRPISAKELPNKEKAEPLFLRNHTLRLGRLNSSADQWQKGRDGKIRSPDELEPIIPPISPLVLKEEVESLPQDKCLVDRGIWKVYLAEAELIPNCLREIGRLREETFRGAGEGTGKEIDLDRFDQWYLHLFLWNGESCEIGGSYRFGPSETILPVHGQEGFYTHSLFSFKPGFFKKTGPVCEMGRSFVVAGHQRSFSSLSLLWKGIGAFLKQNPQYRYVLGAVSISSSYQLLSRELIVKFLFRKFRSRYSNLVSSSLPPEEIYPEFHSKRDVSDNLDTIMKVNGAVSAIEDDGKGIPVLFRQYLKFDTTLLGFNVDEEFSGVIDGLILVDFVKTDPVVGNKLLGADVINTVRDYHKKR
ncbi:MAG: lysophospholipid acyltransferase family protein [Verrucomicrobiales bacterium]|nr:lysophospholipid acyltransferase family protein [Verrucomicrobiales bacterium]